MSKFLTAETLTNPVRISSLVDTVSPYVSVDKSLDAAAVAALAVGLRDVRAADVVSFTLPTSGIATSADGQSIVLRDNAAIAKVAEALRSDTLAKLVASMGSGS